MIHTNQHLMSYSFKFLGVKKRIGFDIILDHYRSRVDPLLLRIQGTAGKSYFIGAIKKALEIEALPEKSPLLLLAPTRVATFNIFGTTIHFSLQIPIK